MDSKLQVFLCHSSEDKPIIRELYHRLQQEGWIDPWLDEEKILPGQDWNVEIEKAVEAADVVVVCLSRGSVNKEGYVQKEIRKVLDISLQKPEGTIFVIPVRLENCEIPRHLTSWQYLDYFPEGKRDASYERLLRSLNLRNAKRAKSQTRDVVRPAEEKRATIPPGHQRDFHTAPLSQEVSRNLVSGVSFVLAKLQWGRDDIGYSLHVEPRTYSTYGMQTTDFLSYLGFRRENCSFVVRGKCYASWVDPEFDAAEFAQKFTEAFSVFKKAAISLESCGFILDQPEGLGYFFDRYPRVRRRGKLYSSGGDGHTSYKSRLLKEAEDDYFQYRLSWIESSNGGGWTFHYHLKDFANQDLLTALKFLKLNKFQECPFFNFEDCFWMHILQQSSGDSPFDRRTELAHRAFDKTPNNLPATLQMLVQANRILAPFGFQFLRS